MLRRNACLVSLGLLLLVVLAGCGGGGDEGSLPPSAVMPQAVGPPEMNPAVAAFVVTATTPADHAVSVDVLKSVTATFDVPMDAATINDTTFVLRQGAKTAPVQGTVTYENQTATFRPTYNLAGQFIYTATLTTGVRNLAGRARTSAFVWHFKTGAKPITLRSARTFAVLAGSTVTSAGLPSKLDSAHSVTVVNGNLGVSPGTELTGFPPGIINGTLHKGDAIAAQAKLDLTQAYDEAVGRARAPVSVSGNLGGSTLYPGLYKSTSSLEISSGDLTLDAQGNPDAVFLFDIASTFTMTPGRRIILSGNARADNIFWRVGSSATLGTTTMFKGNLLAQVSITAGTGATVHGRLLTRTGAVSLDDSHVNRPRL